ncbi:MAG: potassium/proton antiporter [Gammaproteobacteria bacterium]|nr:potassium/proton antiporter [Gammaproteobacteria bacterium]
MEFAANAITLVSLLILISLLSSSLSPRLGIPVLLLYLGVGMLAGEDGLLGIEYEDVTSAYLIGSAALAVILFDGGIKTETGAFRVALAPALSLATLGVVATAGVIAALAYAALDLSWLEALLVGAIVGSTDAAAVFSLLRGRGMALKERVGATLEIESGANDPMAVFLTLILVEAAVTDTLPGWGLATFFLWQMAGGAVIGWTAGAVLAAAVTRLVLSAGMYPLLVIFGALLTFGVASQLETSGFLAVYLAGVTMGARVSRGLYNVQRFLDGSAWLGQITMFLMLGLLVTPTELVTYAPSAMLLGLVLIFVARPVAVALCLAPFRFSWREQLFIAWVGLRGAVPIILALFPWMAGIENWQIFFNIAFFVVLVSLILQGSTVAPLARLAGLEVPSRGDRLQRLELGMPGQEEFELVGYRIDPDSPLVGAAPGSTSWPGEVKALLVIREGRAMQTADVSSFAPGDQIYLLARSAELPMLDRRILAERDPERLGELEFFGEFLIQTEANLKALGDVYGFQVDETDAGLGVGEFLARQFPRPVVGDRVILQGVELVVREVEGNDITRVGLKLKP